MAKKQSRPPIHYLMLGITLALLSLGIVMITSASSILANLQQSDSFYYLKRQLITAAIGLTLMWFLSRSDYRRLKQWAPPLLIFSLAMLAFVLFFGQAEFGSSRWVKIAGFTFQPSEMAKLAVAIYAAHVLSIKKGPVKNVVQLLKPLGAPVALAAFLVLLQPDMGTALTIAVTVYIILFLAEIRGRQMAALGGAGIALALIGIMSSGYRRRRFLAFLNPWGDARGGGFHIIQSLLALGSGGINGVGLGLSRQKFGYLPAPFTDFIFAVIGEELGLIGSVLVVALFALFGFVGMRIATRARDQFGRLLAGGITAMIVSQAIINLGAVTGSLPITGIPLPLISFGGTSLIFTLAGVGILLNIAGQGRSPAARRTPVENIDLRRRNRGPRISRPRAG